MSCSKAITHINLIYANVIYNARCLYSYFCFAKVPFVIKILFVFKIYSEVLEKNLKLTKKF